MKLHKFLLLFLLLTFNIYGKNIISMGVYYERLFIDDKEVSEVIMNLWKKYINKEYPQMHIDVKFYTNKDKLLQDYKDKKLYAIISNNLFYFENKDFFNKYTHSKWIVSRAEGKFEQLFLVKNKDSDFDLKNFNTKEVLYIDSYAREWFEVLVKNNKISFNFKKLKKVKKTKKLLFQPFFKKDSISIMNESIYKAMIDLNPQIKDKVEIVKKSKKIFFLGMNFIRDGLDKEMYKIAEKIINHVNNGSENFENSFFIQIKHILRVEDKDLEELEKFYNNYMN